MYPGRVAISLNKIIPLISIDKDQVRGHVIKIIGDTLLYFIKDNIYKDDRLPLFKLIEARIFDKAV